ncbi:hypothetical protein NDA11_003606 [Ustilago hordei]|uniref:SWIM-type domain-containing protein n=1 Tax=Ustilago hordei TaxID=120017 RepID=I2G3B0_USTHO|nr:uncharacterized protein UHO2_02946 [Ustilago hordei]KAJ1585189.1 hypothetical protein NDA15_003897 [Ustilago hordei]KAJ1587995.1 hypothetical protein NDA12_002779 [Ustilago hordei]KAJ1592964.1 hypothetical protein NDA11_003606 [Ustilago hordei]CCF53653.1 uncharacterized protein UHOR_02237 [Ustilago hordei]SYW78934.1 uncharacterized protein UHO2_02946 [Ustilago hordei]
MPKTKSKTKSKTDDNPGFEITDAKGPSVPPPIRASTRQAVRGKLPPIPKAASPSGTSSSAANDKNETTPSTRKRRRSIGGAGPSEEPDELEQGPSRKYARSPSSSRSPAKSTKAKKPAAEKKESKAKPKKISKAAMERAKLDEVRNDEHFGKLDSDTIKRIAKAHLERMYLIHRFRRDQQTLQETFDVSGSTGNVYKVTVARHVNCSCMDFSLRRKVCKHLLFVYLKVLRLPGSLPVYKSIRLSEDQVAQVFAKALQNPIAEAMARPELRKAWETAVGYQPSPSDSTYEEPAAPQGKRLIPTEGDVCGVCYEDLEPGSVEGLEFCLKSCGRPIHTDCLQTWFNTRGYDRTCIWCRAKWHDSDRQDTHDTNGYGIGLGHHGAVIDRSTGRQLNLAAAIQPEPAQADPVEAAPTEAAALVEAVAAEADTSGWD